MDCSPPGSSVHGILQARILEWVVIPFSRGSSQTRGWTQVFCIAGRFFTVWATKEALPSSAYLRLLIFLLVVLIPACDLPSLAFCVMYSAYKLNKQGDNIQPWRTPFPVLNQSIVPCPVLFLLDLLTGFSGGSKVACYSHLLKNFLKEKEFAVIHTVSQSLLWSTQTKAFAKSVKQK